MSPSSPYGIRSARLQTVKPAPPEPRRPSVEAQLRCYRLLSGEQLGIALREGTINDKSVLTIALEHGWIAYDDLEHAAEEPAAQEQESEPQAEPEPEPAKPGAALFVRLANGDRIHAGTYPTRDLATNEGLRLSARMGRDGEWPLVDGRYVRPDAVVSIDVEDLRDAPGLARVE